MVICDVMVMVGADDLFWRVVGVVCLFCCVLRLWPGRLCCLAVVGICV